MPARPTISIEDFVADPPTVATISPGAPIDEPRLIEGVVLTSLTSGADHRGSLSELLTTRDGLDDPIVHVYQVFANPGSVRAWVFHRLQDDRLAFTNGRLRVVLYDLRPDRPCLLRIPVFVAHGIENTGDTVASFINMPTRVYDPERPDKSRLPADHPGIPYTFRKG